MSGLTLGFIPPIGSYRWTYAVACLLISKAGSAKEIYSGKYSLCAKHTTLEGETAKFLSHSSIECFSLIRWWIAWLERASTAQAAAAGKGGPSPWQVTNRGKFRVSNYETQTSSQPLPAKWFGMQWSAALSKYWAREDARHHMRRCANEGWCMNTTVTFFSHAAVA